MDTAVLLLIRLPAIERVVVVLVVVAEEFPAELLATVVALQPSQPPKPHSGIQRHILLSRNTMLL
jgi:hypothetical protein